MRARCMLFAAASIGIPATAWAHPVGGSGNGITAGLAHPMLGFDHLLAITAVGLLAIRLGGTAAWRLPLAYLFGMSAGLLGGLAAVTLPAAEFGIGLSVVLLGTFLMAGRDLRIGAASVAMTLFGVLHGHAHGTEIPLLAPVITYAIGLILSTGLLMALGMGAGVVFRRRSLQTFRFAGATLAIAGLAILVL